MRVYDNFQTTPSTQAGVSVTAPSGPAPGQVAAEQGQRLGNALMGAGQAGAKVFEDMADQANQVRVNDAMNRARQRANTLAYDPQAGYVNLKGDAALTRPDGQALPDEYGGKLQESLDEISNGLGNDRQKLLFRQQADALLTGFKGDAERHMAQEFKNYAISTQEGTLALAADSAKRNWQDPDKVAGALESAKAAVVEKGRLSGWAAAQTDAAKELAVSKVHHDVIMSALENSNPAYALGYLERNREQMTADDILRVQGQVNQQVWAQVSAQTVAKTSVEFQGKVMPNDFDRMVNITLGSESGGRRYGSDGQLLTSPKGAKGEMQVLDGTNKDPGFGVTPAKDDSPEERARVGRDYLAAMLKRYGDPAKAWAAYNAGPGAVDKAIADQAKNRAGTQGANWLAYLPKETQDYVVKNVNAMANGMGVPSKPTEVEFVNAALAKLPANAPAQLVKVTREQAVQQFTLLNKSATERGDDALAQAQQWLITNQGDINNMPVNLRAAVTQYAPGKMDDLLGFAGKLAKGEAIATDWSLYYTLNKDPALLRETNLAALRNKLATPEFKQLAEDQARLLNPKNEDGTHLQSAHDILNSFLLQAKIDPTPKPGSSDAEKVAQLTSAFRQRIDSAERIKGKKLTEDELRAQAAQVFSPVKVSGFLGFSTDKPTGLVKPDDTLRIPDNERQLIEASLRKAGRPVSDAAIEALYRAHHRIPQQVAQN